MPSLLSMLGLRPARRADAVDARLAEMQRALAETREEAQRWKKKAAELTQQLERFEDAARRLPRVERDLAEAKERLDKLRAVKHALERAERTVAISQEHLLTTETKLDVIEGAIAVLDRRTRRD